MTPFKENGYVDYNTLEQQVLGVLKSSAITGVVVCGSTGEFTRLSFEENTNLMKSVKDVIPHGKQFICGATAGDSYTASKYVEYISLLGADGILLAPPYYFKLNNEEIADYYDDIFNNNYAHTPIIGYNIPQCTNPISVGNFNKLLEYEDFKGFKNSWNDMQEITGEISLRNKKRNDVSMLTGLDTCLYGTMSLGGDGIFSAITYMMPELIDVIYKGGENAFECQCDLLELINIVNTFTFPYGYRVLSQAIGMPLGIGRERIPNKIKTAANRALNEMSEIYIKLIKKYL